MRKNGFSRPYNALQIATWVTLPMLVLQFLFFISPLLPLAASIPCTIFYFAFAVASAYYAYMACVVDPMDHLLARHLNENTSNGEQQQEKKRSLLLFWLPNPIEPKQNDDENDGEDHTKQCWVCDTRVHELSMHCKYCDKCVAHFDHHCQWLNTCIGQANYPYFYATLWAIAGMLIIQVAIMIALVIDFFLKGSTEQRADDWFNANATVPVTAVNIFFIVFCGIALSLVVQLLVFHLGLRKEGLTTYQYIVKDNAKSREKRRMEATRKQKRIIAISKARSEHKACLANRLIVGEHLGKVCACCDPLPPESVVDVEEAQNGCSHILERQEDEDEASENDVEAAATSNGNGKAANGSITTNGSSIEFVQINGSRREEESKAPEEEFVENGV